MRVRNPLFTFGETVTFLHRSAFFTLCKQHRGQGFIVFSDGSVSEHFSDATDGWEILRAMKREGKISEEEFRAVAEQIDSCSFDKESDSAIPDHMALIIVALDQPEDPTFTEFRRGPMSMN